MVPCAKSRGARAGPVWGLRDLPRTATNLALCLGRVLTDQVLCQCSAERQDIAIGTCFAGSFVTLGSSQQIIKINKKGSLGAKLRPIPNVASLIHRCKPL